MGVNNRARRSAKQRKRSERSHRAPRTEHRPRVHQHSGGVDERAEISELARRLVPQVGVDPRLAREHAERLSGEQRSVARGLVGSSPTWSGRCWPDARGRRGAGVDPRRSGAHRPARARPSAPAGAGRCARRRDRPAPSRTGGAPVARRADRTGPHAGDRPHHRGRSRAGARAVRRLGQAAGARDGAAAARVVGPLSQRAEWRRRQAAGTRAGAARQGRVHHVRRGGRGALGEGAAADQPVCAGPSPRRTRCCRAACRRWGGRGPSAVDRPAVRAAQGFVDRCRRTSKPLHLCGQPRPRLQHRGWRACRPRRGRAARHLAARAGRHCAAATGPAHRPLGDVADAVVRSCLRTPRASASGCARPPTMRSRSPSSREHWCRCCDDGRSRWTESAIGFSRTRSNARGP